MTVDGDQVTEVRGDRDHPVSRGYTCPKGRALPALHHHPARLDSPRVGDAGTDWDHAIGDLADRLQAIVDEHGPDAVGGYFGTGLAYDTAGWVAASAWLAAVGSSRLFTPATVDNAPVLLAAELVAGHPQANPVCDFDAAELVLVFGSNPVISHGYGTAFPNPIVALRSVLARGGAVWVVDPRRTETAAIADRHVAARPGSDAIVLAWLVRERLDHPLPEAALEATTAADRAVLTRALHPFTLDRAAASAGVEPATLLELRDAVLAAEGALATWCGTGVTMSRDGLVAEWLRWALLALSGSLDTGRGMHFHRGTIFPLRRSRRAVTAAPNSRPIAGRPELRHWIGQDPCVALADEVAHGSVRALVVAGANPLTAFPDPAATHAALGRLDVLAVAGVVDDDLTAIASHVLPVTAQLERADVPMNEYVSVRSGTCYSPAVIAPAADRKPAWWVFATLAEHLTGRPVFGVPAGELTDDGVLAVIARRASMPWDAIRAAGPHGVAAPPAIGWWRDEFLGGGPWRIAPAPLVARLASVAPPHDGPVLVPRRRMRANNSVPDPVDPGREALALLHPRDGRAAGVADGGTVKVTSAYGSIEVPVRFDPGLRPGVIAISHGDPAGNPGALVSAHHDIDPLTGMPRASGLPVTVEYPPA